MEIFKSFGNKKIGYLKFDNETQFDSLSLPCYKSGDCYILLYLKSDSTINFDFVEYKTNSDTLFFFNIGQKFYIENNSIGELVYFNPNFYCIAFHDKELTCDGVLFNNVFETPSINLNIEETTLFSRIINDIKNELEKEDYWTEEMSRTKLKELIIKASRVWVSKEPNQKGMGTTEDELSRKFSQLVEVNYQKYHSVSEYAELLFISPKTLNRKIVREKGISANSVIKNRIILQAKRLLVNTDLTVKEISAHLGYEDQSYFIRFFKIQSGKTPIEFRKNTLSK